MGKNISYKIFEKHLVKGNLKKGEEIEISVDQALLQDATGTLAWLQFEAIGLNEIRIPLAVTYIDHNTLQIDHLNPDDHKFLQTISARYGAWFSRAGNGICHQVHLERFAKPGAIILGSDSHTPTAGGIGAIGIGVGGMEVACALAGEPFTLVVPEIIKVYLEGTLKKPWVCAMDVVLEILKRLSVKGGIGKILEYTGPSVKTLTVTERATITNFGAELGATSSIFPSDENTLHFLKAQKREKDFIPLTPDKDAEYDGEIYIDLSKIEPLVAKPFSPDNVSPLISLLGLKVDQVNIGSCTNSSYQIMKGIGKILENRTVAPNVNLSISPGSKQVLEMMAKEGILSSLISSGARILECACGPCIGMGQAPISKGVSFRSFNRNFKGRSGTLDAEVYLANPYICALIAIYGEVVNPYELNIEIPEFKEPDEFLVNDNILIAPLPNEKRKEVNVIKGPNIKEVPRKEPLEDKIRGEILIKLGDNISTDDILPAGAKILPLRSNIPRISDFVFSRIDSSFAKRAKEKKIGFIAGGENYGQGSSREHAAIAPSYLGIKAIFAKSFARIHRANLINFGVLPLVFKNPQDFNLLQKGDVIEIKDILRGLDKGSIKGELKGREIEFEISLTSKEKEVLKAGGLLNWISKKNYKEG